MKLTLWHTSMLLFLSVLFGCSEQAEPAESPSEPAPAVEDHELSVEVAAFLENYMQNSMLSIELSRAYAQRGDNEAVQDFAAEVIEQHLDLTQDLKDLAPGYDIELELVLSPANEMMVYDFADAAEEADFTNEYLDRIITDHYAMQEDIRRIISRSDALDVNAVAVKIENTVEDVLRGATRVQPLTRDTTLQE